jgi:hypothetical protein
MQLPNETAKEFRLDDGPLNWKLDQRDATEIGIGELLTTGGDTPSLRLYCKNADEFVRRGLIVDTFTGAGQDLRSRRTKEDSDWYGTTSFEIANELADTGWSDARRQALPVAEAATSRFGRTVGVRWSLDWRRAGGAYDPVRDLVGSHDIYRVPAEIESPTVVSKVHRIHVNISAHSGIDAEDLLKAGGMVVALIESLRILGHTADIIVGEAVMGRNRATLWQGFQLHKATEILDADRLCYWLAHPSALRRHFFAVQESLNPRADAPERVVFGTGVSGGYGAPQRTPQDVLDRLGITIDLGTAQARVQHVDDEDSQYEWLHSTLKEMGVI